jgi:uridine kinase
LLVAVTGGTGSGKSTLAEALVQALRPGCAVLVSEDWYYRDVAADAAFDPAGFDFDDVAVRDHALLARHLLELKAGRPVLAPSYCFIRHARLERQTPLTPSQVVIVEGAQLLHPPELRALFDLKIYLDTPDDIRFIRRLVRDQAERGREVASIVSQYLATARPAHVRLTAPCRTLADLEVRDDSGAVEDPRPEVLQALAEPILSHALLRPLRAERGGRP